MPGGIRGRAVGDSAYCNADGGVAEFGAAAPNTTNNQMELQAAIEALAHLGKAPQATVYTDSRYVIDGLTNGCPTGAVAVGSRRPGRR